MASPHDPACRQRAATQRAAPPLQDTPASSSQTPQAQALPRSRGRRPARPRGTAGPTTADWLQRQHRGGSSGSSSSSSSALLGAASAAAVVCSLLLLAGTLPALCQQEPAPAPQPPTPSSATSGSPAPAPAPAPGPPGPGSEVYISEVMASNQGALQLPAAASSTGGGGGGGGGSSPDWLELHNRGAGAVALEVRGRGVGRTEEEGRRGYGAWGRMGGRAGKTAASAHRCTAISTEPVGAVRRRAGSYGCLTTTRRTATTAAVAATPGHSRPTPPLRPTPIWSSTPQVRESWASANHQTQQTPYCFRPA